METVIRLICLGLVSMLLACENTVTIVAPVFNLSYTVGDFDYASRNGEIRTRIGDDPFGGPQKSFSTAVTDLMYGANFGGDVAFAPSPAGAGSGRFHVVMLFNPPVSADETDFCAPNAKVSTLPLSGRLTLVAVFCYKDTMLSTANGRVTGVRNRHAPLFRALVRQVTLALFPIYDGLDVNDSGGNTAD